MVGWKRLVGFGGRACWFCSVGLSQWFDWLEEVCCVLIDWFCLVVWVYWLCIIGFIGFGRLVDIWAVLVGGWLVWLLGYVAKI